MKMFSDLSVSEFISKLASESPVPGGGSASAISGAMGAALLSMVTGIALKNDTDQNRYGEVSDRCSRIAKEFLILSEEDAKSFREVLDAYRLPKNTDDEKDKRKQAIQMSLKTASLVPLTVMKKVDEVSNYLDEIFDFSTDSTRSDFLCALLLLETSIKGAFYNVQINLKSIKDNDFIVNIIAEGKNIYKSFLNRKNKFQKYLNSEV
jgi:formiminotetrahydrofolate cyclodeaminase